MSDNAKIIEELEKAREERINQLVMGDPQLQRIQGALDFAEGKIALPDESEEVPEVE
jgi:hypothetical protein